MRVCCHIALLWLSLLAAVQSHGATLLVVVPKQTALTEEFVSQLSRERHSDTLIVYNIEDPKDLNIEPDLTITLGVASLEWQRARTDTGPTIATYITQSVLQAADLQPLPANINVLLASPQPIRQLRLARLLIPRIRAAAMLHSPAYTGSIALWNSAAESSSVKLNVVELSPGADLARTLVGVLDRGDVLIGLDDPRIYNADSLKTILLTSYTRNRVLIGPSAPFIAAGSLSTTFSTPADMARSVDYLINQNGPKAAAVYPRFFSVLSNQQVARSMGFAPPDDAELAAELARMEGMQ